VTRSSVMIIIAGTVFVVLIFVVIIVPRTSSLANLDAVAFTVPIAFPAIVHFKSVCWYTSKVRSSG
jgi:hypothetical protein